MQDDIPRQLEARGCDAHFILPTSQREVLALLDALREDVLAMGELGRFPEGAPGVLLWALLERAMEASPDVGDFNYATQGFEQLLEAATAVLCERFAEHPFGPGLTNVPQAGDDARSDVLDAQEWVED